VGSLGRLGRGLGQLAGQDYLPVSQGGKWVQVAVLLR
jgi:hypothetical protein